MQIHPLMKTQSNLQVSHLVTNSLLSYEAFMVLKDFPIFFTKHMSTFFKTLIEQGYALIYIDDILLLSNSKEHMFQPIEQLHIIGTKNNPKLAPENPFSCFLRLKSLDMKLAITQSNLFTQKLQLFTKSFLPLEKLP